MTTREQIQMLLAAARERRRGGRVNESEIIEGARALAAGLADTEPSADELLQEAADLALATRNPRASELIDEVCARLRRRYGPAEAEWRLDYVVIEARGRGLYFLGAELGWLALD